jgi:hypothetical protein
MVVFYLALETRDIGDKFVLTLTRHRTSQRRGEEAEGWLFSLRRLDFSASSPLLSSTL